MGIDLLVIVLGVLLVPVLLFSGLMPVFESFGVTTDATPALFIASQTALNFIGYLLVGVGYLVWRSDRSLVGFGWPRRRPLVALVGGFLGLAAIMLGLESFFEAVGVELAENEIIREGRAHPELFVFLIPVQFLLVGPAEELVFRGLIQGLLRRAYGMLPGIVLGGAVFSLFHLPALGMTGAALPTLLIIFCSGLLLGGLYEYTGTLLVPIVVHAAWNALVFATLYSGTSGMVLVWESA